MLFQPPGINTPVTIDSGGTGATILALNSALVMSGTSFVTGVTPGPNGNVFTSNGTNWVSSTPVTSAAGPTFLALLTGASTFTPPASTKYLRILMVGGGAGGGSNGTGDATGASGTASIFGTSFLIANGGGPGGSNSSAGAGGIGGLPTLGILRLGLSYTGSTGQYCSNLNVNIVGGDGGSSPFQGRGSGGGSGSAGHAAGTNTGSGGGGSGGFGALGSAGGGGSGAYIDVLVPGTSLAASYSYTVGGGGNGGTAGTGGAAGGNGGSGAIYLWAFFA